MNTPMGLKQGGGSCAFTPRTPDELKKSDGLVGSPVGPLHSPYFKSTPKGWSSKWPPQSDDEISRATNLWLGGMQIYVDLPDGKSITLDVTESERIWNIKEKIQIMEGIPIDQQCLLFAGNQLEDLKTLNYYNVQAASSILLLS